MVAVGVLCVAQTVAVWGEHVLFYNGLTFWAYDHLGGARGVSMALGAVTFPALFSYPAGLLVGALPPKLVLAVCAAIRAALAFLLLALVLRPGFSPLAILGVAASILLVDSFFMPVLKAALPGWSGTHEARRARANALLEATDAPGFILGPLFAVAFYHARGIAGPAFALAISYAVALVFVLAVPRPAALMPSETQAAAVAMEPVAPPPTLPNAPSVPLLIGAWTVGMFVLGLTQALALPFVLEVLHRSEHVYGVLAAVLGGGITVGAVLWSLDPILRVPTSRRFTLALLFGGGALIGGALAVTAFWCGVAWFLGGIGLVGVPLTLTTLLQEESAARRRTGLLGLTHTTEAAGLLLGELAAFWLQSRLGLRGAFGLGGVLLLFCAAVTVAQARHRGRN